MTAWLGLGPEALTAAAAAALLIGITKGGLGGGAGTVALPLLALTMPVPAAAALLLPVLIGSDVFTIHHYRRTHSRQDLRLLLPAALAGVLLGGLAFGALAAHERVFAVGVGIVTLAFVLWQAVRARVLQALESSPPSRTWGGLLGGLAGFLSTLAHVGGPPVAMYLIARGLPREVYVGTTAWFFFAVNLAKLLPYAFLGLLGVSNLLVALALLPLAFLGTVLGVWLLRVVDQRMFLGMVYVLLVATGLELVVGSSLLGLLAQLRA